VRFSTHSGGTSLLLLYGALGMVVSAWFARSLSKPEATRGAYLGFAVLTGFKFGVFSLDYRFMGNYHYMAFLMSAAFLMVPGRRVFMPVLLCLFYACAATLKFNAEWLSGAALLRPSFLSPELEHLALAAVIPVELLVVWGLLLNPSKSLKDRKQFTFALFALGTFHAFSWHIVGYFYPLTMGLLLSIAWLPWLLGERTPEAPSILRRFFSGKAHVSNYVLAVLFLGAQVPQHLGTSDSTLTGEGRIFALNMLDAKSQCLSYAFARSVGRVEEIPVDGDTLGIRIHCDPVVLYNRARAVCRERAQDPAFLDLDLYLVSKRTTDQSFRPVIASRDFCKTITDYRILTANPWILASEDPKLGGVSNANENWVPWSQAVGEVKPTGEITSMFRGNHERTGHVTGDPKRYADLELLFRVPNGNIGVHSASKASPALDESGVYVGGDSGWFYAYEWSGALRWKFHVAGAERGIHGTAALDADSVYLGAYNGRLYRLGKQSGAPIWTIDLGDALGASPALLEGDLYANVEIGMPNGYLAKLAREDGHLAWTSKLFGEQSHASPTLDPKSNTVYAGYNDQFFRALDSKSGALRWAIHTEGPIKSTAAILGDALFFTSWDQGLYAVHRTDGHLLWRAPLRAKSRSSPAAWEELGAILVLDESGALHLLDAKTGASRWERTFENNLRASASATIVGNGAASVAIVPCGVSRICIVDSEGTVVNEVPTKAAVTGMVVPFKDRLCLSENAPGDLVCYESTHSRK
jgi:outer membrane protein assembly factor BamB